MSVVSVSSPLPKFIFAAALLVHPARLPAQVTLTVDAKGVGPAVSPTMFGIFFEDINYAGDGGLYAELVENRSFEHRDGMHAWRVESRDDAEGKAGFSSEQPIHENNPRFLALEVVRPGGGFGVSNLGYGGIPVKAGEDYRFAVYARAPAGYAGRLIVRIEDETGKALAEGALEKIADTFARSTLMLTPSATTAKARLVVLADAVGRVDLDMISLFPKNTFKQRENGLRADLAQMLADLKPGFIRFPGGCIVEGRDLANAYRWKDTVGEIWERKQNANLWQSGDPKRPDSHYHQTYGLGFFEYFQFCEDIGAEAVPVLNCGMSCQFRGNTPVDMKDIDPWVQDALDLVEFANGPADSRWGGLRARMGHPEPFHLKRIAIGNEQWGETYFERYAVFQKALSSRYPDLLLISTAGAGVDDGNWELAWGKFKSGEAPAHIVDEHYYRPPAWFLTQADRYDGYDRKAPKVFAGEYAAHRADRKSSVDAAVCEAAFMTGLLRNSDVVVMTSYAPLFARDGFTQWTPDLIWFDAMRTMPTPSYHVQVMYGQNRPDRILPMQMEMKGDEPAPSGRIGVGTWRTQAEFRDIEVKQGDKVLYRSVDVAPGGWTFESGEWEEAAGALRQKSGDEPAVALAGDPSWTDVTLTLKARKSSGDEGFLILFQASADDEKYWWNIGGWGNTSHALELPGFTSPHVPGKIETGRWYDIRIETRGPEVACFLDNVEIHRAKRPPVRRVYAVAGVDDRAGEIILHLSNASGAPAPVVAPLKGWKASGEARGSVLTSAGRSDINTLAEPARVAPAPARVRVQDDAVHCTLPPWSHTVIRVPGKTRGLF